MKSPPVQDLERIRWIAEEIRGYGQTGAGTMNGVFAVKRKGTVLRIIASDGEGWEHVSVSIKHRCPTWDEMCFVKDLFWRGDEEVVQFHPPKSEYVNIHPFCLHLWRPTGGVTIPMPPAIFVGPRADPAASATARSPAAASR